MRGSQNKGERRWLSRFGCRDSGAGRSPSMESWLPIAGPQEMGSISRSWAIAIRCQVTNLISSEKSQSFVMPLPNLRFFRSLSLFSIPLFLQNVVKTFCCYAQFSLFVELFVCAFCDASKLVKVWIFFFLTSGQDGGKRMGLNFDRVK